MPCSALQRVGHAIRSHRVSTIGALALSTFVAVAQPVPTIPAPTAAGAPSSATAVPAYLGTVSGGLNNTASGVAATVGGGFGNTASGYFAAVGGGFGNVAAGSGSFVAGSNAQDGPSHVGVFLFADSSGTPFHSAASNEFAARATGGVRFALGVDETGTPTWSCAASYGNNWACSSDRNLKENLHSVDVAAVLARVAGLPLYLWNAKGTDPNVRHLGPTAQDFMAAFALGSSSTMIGMQDADGVALAAIQGLNQLLEEQRQSLARQQQRIAMLEDRVAQLDAMRSEIAALRQELSAPAEGRTLAAARH